MFFWFFSKWNNVVLIEKNEKRFWDREIRAFELIIDDVEIDEANWLEMSVANFDDDDFSNWRINRIEMIQKIVFLNWLKNCVEIDEKIKEWVTMNQCDDDEKERRKEENYKSVLIFSSTSIIAIIIFIVINIIVVIIIEEDVNCCEDFDILFICFVEFFAFVSFLREKDWKKISELDFEKDLKKKFVCVVFLFVEFAMLENVHFDCEFCDSILIFLRFSASCFVASFVVFSILKSSTKKNQSSFISFFSMKERESEIEKKIVFTSCSFVCFFVDSSIENVFVLIFSIFELSFLIFFVWSLSAFLNSRKYEIVRRKKKKFLNVKIVTKSNVSDFRETRSSSFLLLNKFCVETIEIEKKEEKKRNRFCFESFAIDFVLNCFHVKEIENLQCVVSIIEESQNLQKESFRKKKNVFRSVQSISRKSINFEWKWYESDSKSSWKKKNVEINISRKKSSVYHEEDRTTQILDDNFIVTNVADVVSLIDHHVRFWDF